MVLQPFLCAAILGRRWDWLYVPALVLVLTAFIVREPLLVLARQQWIWRERKLESAAARRCLLWQVPLVVALSLLCLRFLPPAPFLVLAGAAAAVTLLALWMTLHNRQRSLVLQVVSSLGLGATALLAALIGARGLPEWSWLLWALLGVHAIASVLVVRARLEFRARAGSGITRWAWAFQIALAAAAAALAFSGNADLAAVIGLSAAVSAFELVRLGSRRHLAEPLTRVGFRTLGTSLAHSAVAIAALW
jgi:hypothetical protein